MHRSLSTVSTIALILATNACSLEQKPAPYVQKGDEIYTKSASNYYMPSSGRKTTQINTSFGGAEVQSYDLTPTNSSNPYSRNDGVIDFSNQQQNNYQTSQYNSGAPISRPIVSDYIDAPNNPVSSSGEYGFVNNNNNYQTASVAQRARPIIDEPTSKPAYNDNSIDFVQQKPASGFAPNTNSDSAYLDLGAVNQFNNSQATPTAASATSKLGRVSVLSKPEYAQEVKANNELTTSIENVEIQPPTQTDNSDFVSVPPLQEVASVVPTKTIEQPAIASQDSQEDEIENSAIIRSSTPITTDKMFMRPIAGEIIAKFGNEKDGTFNDGIKIKAAKGTEVKAADGGEIVYSGNQLQGYGNMVIIRHASGYLTSYAHLEGLDLQKGIKVSKGDIIGKVGDTGNVNEPQLHFGVREGREPVDPQKFL